MVYIEKRRRDLGMRQVELAEKVGMTQGAISMIENGERTPSVSALVEIAKALKCSVDDLLKPV